MELTTDGPRSLLQDQRAWCSQKSPGTQLLEIPLLEKVNGNPQKKEKNAVSHTKRIFLFKTIYLHRGKKIKKIVIILL